MKPYYLLVILITISISSFCKDNKTTNDTKTRIIVTSDAEIDDECSFVRCLLYANEYDIEGIISTSSQYHAHDHNWAGDDWYVKYLDAYTEIYSNLIKHDTCYPAPDSLKAITFLGNVTTEGDMTAPTPGSQHIVKVLLDTSDNRPVWLQAWGGMNTIARALKSIEEEHPDKMEYVAGKCRFFFIWEQDNTFQTYIKPVWGKYNIPTIISDQFVALFYKWKQYIPSEQQNFLLGTWMNENIKINHGPLCSLYKSNDNGDFRSEGDSPSFMHAIPTGLRNLENPGWGGWAGRYTNIRENTWLDPVAEPGYQYPEGRWYTSTAWGRQRIKLEIPKDTMLMDYLKPIWRWMETFQNDFASRADWCVKSYEEANHPPEVMLAHELDLKAVPGDTLKLSALGTIDPDGDSLIYHWWQYQEADTYDGTIEIKDVGLQEASFIVPDNFSRGKTIHIICEVADTGTPQLVRYQRVVVESDAYASPKNVAVKLTGVNKVDITWEDINDDETGFRIERAEGDTGSFTTAAEVQANITSYIDTALNESTLYRYRVVAFNGTDTSPYNGIVTVTTLNSKSLPTPVSDPSPENNAVDINTDTILMWKASINADSYDVYFGTENPPPFSINQDETIFDPGGLIDGETYYWRIDGKNINGITEGMIWSFKIEGKLTSEVETVPDGLLFIRNYPNPFNSLTRINYVLNSHSEVKLYVYNLMGKLIAILVDQWQTAGEYSVTFDAGTLESGVYFFSLKTGLSEHRGKMLLMK